MSTPETYIADRGRVHLRPARTFLSSLALLAALAQGVMAQNTKKAESPQDIGAAIARTCTTINPATQGVIAGVVTDSLTGVTLPDARVKLVWQGPNDTQAQTASVDTNKDGFYTFCNVPAGLLVLLTANLRVTSPPRTVGIQAGMLNVENIRLAVSNPDKPGVLVGRVIDASTRQPIPDVSVELVQTKKQVLTNDRGYFSFGEQSFGTYTLKLQHLAYKTRQVPLHISGNLTQNVEIEMTQRPIELPGIQVSVMPRTPNYDLQGMIRRMSLGFGTFITRETLERRPEAKLADILRGVSGISVFRNGIDAYLEVRGMSCNPVVYLDGQYHPLDPDLGVNEFYASDLEAIEIYKGGETPAEFLRPGFQAPCATIVMWSHRGGG
ncbi:MAG: carboxypeptidase regulatory-like domain-containing protein [Gemmatimonadetes bacterium]|nr:carboxypeptidase regulatory-like domain-containing protein [Gemmatimonadota bacterium]